MFTSCQLSLWLQISVCSREIPISVYFKTAIRVAQAKETVAVVK